MSQVLRLNFFAINPPTELLHRPPSLTALSFLGRTKEERHIVCLWLRVLSEHRSACQPMGHHPSRPRTQSQSLTGPIVASQFHFLWEWKATGSQGLLYALQYAVPDMTAVMPCVKWQTSIFAKLLPAFPKEAIKNNNNKYLIWTTFRGISRNNLPPEWIVSRSFGQMVRPEVLVLAEA